MIQEDEFIVTYGGKQQVVTVNHTSSIEQITRGFRLKTQIDTGDGYDIVKEYTYYSENQDREFVDTYALICSKINKIKEENNEPRRD